MFVKHRVLITGAAAFVLTSCADFLGSRDTNTLELNPAFQSVPAGFSANSNSFDPSGDTGPFYPGQLQGGMTSGPDGGHGGRKGDGERRDGFGGPSLRGLLMGGGLGPDFLGRIGWGKGRGPFGWFYLPDTCTYDVITARVGCPDKVRDGLTVTISFAFTDTAGAPQPKFDTTSTNTVNVKTTVKGTRVRKDSSVSVLDHASDRTVTGFAPGSTQRVINSVAHASETTTGVRDSVPFTVVRLATDSTRGLTIPIRSDRPTIPTAGVVIRTMSATITPEGGEAKTRSRREMITFDGTNVIKIVITQDGVTKNCTITLPGGQLVCD
jgi:hypothetical protein